MCPHGHRKSPAILVGKKGKTMSFYSVTEEIQDVNDRMEFVLRSLDNLTVIKEPLVFDAIWSTEDGRVFGRLSGWAPLDHYPNVHLSEERWKLEDSLFEEELAEIKADVLAVIPLGIVKSLRVGGVDEAELTFNFGHVRGFVA